MSVIKVDPSKISDLSDFIMFRLTIKSLKNISKEMLSKLEFKFVFVKATNLCICSNTSELFITTHNNPKLIFNKDKISDHLEKGLIYYIIPLGNYLFLPDGYQFDIYPNAIFHDNQNIRELFNIKLEAQLEPNQTFKEITPIYNNKVSNQLRWVIKQKFSMNIHNSIPRLVDVIKHLSQTTDISQQKIKKKNETKQLPSDISREIIIKNYQNKLVRDKYIFSKNALENIFKDLEKILQKIDAVKEDTESLNKKADEMIESLDIIKNELKEFDKEFDELSKILDNSIKKELEEIKESIDKNQEYLVHLAELQKDKILPHLAKENGLRKVEKDEWAEIIEAKGKWEGNFKKALNKMHFQNVIVLTFECDNSNCEEKYRFIYFETTKLAKILRTAIKLIPFSQFTQFIGGLSKDSKIVDKEFLEKANKVFKEINNKATGDKLPPAYKEIIPSDITIFYRLLIGIEDKYSRSLIKTFKYNVQEKEFHCYKCNK